MEERQIKLLSRCYQVNDWMIKGIFNQDYSFAEKCMLLWYEYSLAYTKIDEDNRKMTSNAL